MKQLYHIVFEVEDDEIIDNRLESETSYLSFSRNSGEMTNRKVEGYVEPYNIIKPEQLDISKLEVDEKSVIVFQYDDDVMPEEAPLVKEILQNEFPDNKVLGITKNIDLLSQYPNEAIDMLNRMIAHIKIVNI